MHPLDQQRGTTIEKPPMEYERLKTTLHKKGMIVNLIACAQLSDCVSALNFIKIVSVFHQFFESLLSFLDLSCDF